MRRQGRPAGKGGRQQGSVAAPGWARLSQRLAARTCMRRTLSPLMGGMSLLTQLSSRTFSLTSGRVRRTTLSETRHSATWCATAAAAAAVSRQPAPAAASRDSRTLAGAVRCAAHLVLAARKERVVVVAAVQRGGDGVEKAGGTAAQHQQHLGAAGRRLHLVVQQLLHQSCV